VALDTSGPVGSVAVAREGRVVARAFLTSARGHAAELVPAIERSLNEAGSGRSDLGGVVVGAGPGSFTGVRVAAATAKGLAHGLGIPLWAPSSLEAAAVTDVALPPGVGPWDPPAEPISFPVTATRYVLFDARGERFYAACYRVGPDGLEVLREPRVRTLADILAEPRQDDVRFAGTGAVRHRARITGEGHVVLPLPAGMPTADGLVRLVSTFGHDLPVADPWRWEPEYLRASSAERAALA
jgi:tRNA threonylcarbamoyladenosine biosynthesis protein TsaB